MVNTIDMQGMRYLNLFEKITRVQTRYFFRYNETIMFCVPKSLLGQALGRNNENLKKMSDILKKRIRVIPKPRGIQDIKFFIQSIINPVTFKDLEVKEDEIVLNAGNANKAALIGRNKRRFLEMQKIIKDYFGKEFKII
ncbi:MAG: hypothetical protein WC812_02525 [Candidatus Pacearchaeota archaeon]|jgi:transcription antitermination factor NusA-like protein